MPRANRYIVAGQIYHLTHRCHNQAFLFRFGIDRESYRRWLREGLERHAVSLLNYCVTSNHVRLLMHSESVEAVANLMQLVEGSMAQEYNLRKKRSGAFWGERYHCTMIDSGEYLWRCLQYVDLNMVRAGVVQHPQEWTWGGYPELMGIRKRYRLLTPDKLTERLGCSLDEFKSRHEDRVRESLARAGHVRDPKWTECLAVGSEAFVEQMSAHFDNRRALVVQQDQSGSGDVWTIREEKSAYGRFSG